MRLSLAQTPTISRRLGNWHRVLPRRPRPRPGGDAALRPPRGQTRSVEIRAQSAIQVFGAEFVEHYGRPCPRPREIPVPKIVDVDEHGAFVCDDPYHLKQPDCTLSDEEDRTS